MFKRREKEMQQKADNAASKKESDKTEEANGSTQVEMEELKTDRGDKTEPEQKRPKTDNVITSANEAERRPIDWADKLYLAPLTTVGNLPFRRVCKRFGADITCGEMAMAQPLLQGHAPEWALLQRHASEDLFGVQLCGGSPQQMARAAHLIEAVGVDCDFVDVNLGCPIDLVYQRGMGAGLMARRKPLEVMVRAMAAVLTRPLTLKMRTGVYADKKLAGALIPAAFEWGAAAVTLHGRSREQRYTKSADWAYVAECGAVAPGPLFGNGDVLSYEDYAAARAAAPAAVGVMVARGALIKPWLFTEIKERRRWDISAGERMDMLRDFCSYGLEHWGSDDKGVETTRRFLLEWLSFLHRYVPAGILAQPTPQRINERLPGRIVGRCDDETLLSSPRSARLGGHHGAVPRQGARRLLLPTQASSARLLSLSL